MTRASSGRCWAAVTKRVYGVLRFHRRDDLRNRDAQFGQSIGFHPNAHRVGAAKDLHAPHARHARKFIHVVDVGVIGQEVPVVRRVG